MTVASGARGVVAAFGSFLVAAALEDSAAQIEAEAFGRRGPGECEKQFPKWPPELFNLKTEVAADSAGGTVTITVTERDGRERISGLGFIR